MLGNAAHAQIACHASARHAHFSQLEAKMEGCVFALFLLVVLSGCSRAREVSEKSLYTSEMWKSGARAVLLREQGALGSAVHVLHVCIHQLAFAHTLTVRSLGSSNVH